MFDYSQFPAADVIDAIVNMDQYGCYACHDSMGCFWAVLFDGETWFSIFGPSMSDPMVAVADDIAIFATDGDWFDSGLDDLLTRTPREEILLALPELGVLVVRDTLRREALVGRQVFVEPHHEYSCACWLVWRSSENGGE